MKFQCGNISIDTDNFRLEKNGQAIPTEPLVFNLIACLIENRNRLVSRQELLDTLWSGRHVSDTSLSNNIKSARKALGDDGQRQQIIRTAHGRGYQFIADIVEVTDGVYPETEPVRGFRKRHKFALAGLVLLLILLIFDPFEGMAGKEDLESSIYTIAVLPFVNLSDDASNEYFSEGLSEELLNLLARIPELNVAARTSSFSYKGKDTQIAQIGEELNVTHILEGSVRKSGNHVRITVQLIKTSDGFHLWSETFDRTLDDVFITQDEIATAVILALRVTLLGAMPEQRVTDTEVYALYLQGGHFANLRSKENLEKAQLALEQALDIDPQYAPAWVSINIVYGEQAKHGFRASEEAFALSMAAVEKALAIDSNSAGAWASLAYLKRGQSDWAGAKTAIDQALELEPNNAQVIGAAATLAGTFGQLDKSIELFERNVRLNPLSLSSTMALAIRYVCAGRNDEAFEMINRILVIHPDFPAIHYIFAEAYLLKGDPETALLELNKDSSTRDAAFLKTRIFSTLGRESEAQALITQLLEGSANLEPLHMARTYAWRGENDQAFEWLEKMSQESNPPYTLFLIEPWFRNLVTDPRYAVFVEKIGLLEDWEAMSPEYGGPPDL